jgi:hypothetical protein
VDGSDVFVCGMEWAVNSHVLEMNVAVVAFCNTNVLGWLCPLLYYGTLLLLLLLLPLLFSTSATHCCYCCFHP